MTEESLWREAVERAPKKLRPKLQLARALPAAKGLELLAKARLDAPYDPAIATETGKILLAEGQPDGALEEFGRALALAPTDARNMNNRGVALLALGQTEAARADFERALRTDPSLAEARRTWRNCRRSRSDRDRFQVELAATSVAARSSRARSCSIRCDLSAAGAGR